MSVDLLTFAGILIALIIIGLFQNKTILSEESYLYAKRECGLWPLTCTLVMTELNTSTLLAFSGLGYVVGKRALYLPVMFLVGLLFYALTVAKKWKELDADSVATLFRERYGSLLAKVASLMLTLAMLGFTATYVKSMTFIFTPIFPGLTPWALSGFLMGLILVMTLRGGLVSIIRTDVYSFLLMCLILPLVFFFSWKNRGAVTHTPTLLPSKFIISLIVLTMFTYILAPWYGQKIFSAKSKRVAFLAVFFAAILVFIFYGLGVMATSFLQLNIPTAELALPTIINLYFPDGLRGVAYATLFLISATTLAGVWSAMSSMVIADFWKKGKDFKRGLALTFGFALLSYLLGNTLVDRILDKLILANIPVAALSFALLAGFYWKRATPLGALLSMMTGLGWGLYCYFHFGEQGLYTWYWAMYGIPLIFGVGIAGSFIQLTAPLVDEVSN